MLFPIRSSPMRVTPGSELLKRIPISSVWATDPPPQVGSLSSIPPRIPVIGRADCIPEAESTCVSTRPNPLAATSNRLEKSPCFSRRRGPETFRLELGALPAALPVSPAESKLVRTSHYSSEYVRTPRAFSPLRICAFYCWIPFLLPDGNVEPIRPGVAAGGLVCAFQGNV